MNLLFPCDTYSANPDSSSTKLITRMSSEHKPIGAILDSPSNTSDQTSKHSAPLETPDEDIDETTYPSGLNLALIFVALCTSTFLVALDATIIATAIPTITNQFNSLSDVSWYNAAFLLTTCAFQLPFGRAYSLFSNKWVFISAIGLFEIGSAVCGSAPTSMALIIGRAIQG